MHTSSLLNMKYFAEKYMDSKKHYKILDIGSQEVDGDENGSYRHLFQNPNWEYIGADVVKGKNVDIVLQTPYEWKNIKSKSFDCVVCGQMLEHDEFFWLTMLEIKRIMKPNGICCLIAPSGGPEHRYPVDCYRYYPDGLRAVARYAGLETLEAYAQWNAELYPEMDPDWRDCVLICRCPKETAIENMKFALRHWMLNVSSRSAVNVKYGNVYSQETTWRTPTPNLFSSLYIDTGIGFNEGQVIRYGVKTTQRYKQRYELPEGCESVRFDPVEGHRCMVRNLQIVSDGSVKNADYDNNGKQFEKNSYFFMNTTDPQILIPVENAEWIEIQADINYVG